MALCSFSKFSLFVIFVALFVVSAENEVVPNASILQAELKELANSLDVKIGGHLGGDPSEEGEQNNAKTDSETTRGNSEITREANVTQFNSNTTTNSGTNETFNTTSVPSHRWPCKSFNITNTSTTVIINNETLYTEVLAKMNSTHGCGLLLFYSPYCEFSTNLAPLYNAVGRSYPDLAVIALDTQEAMGMAARYGVVGIPTVFFFYSGRPVAKFNRSRTPASFEKFIMEMSGYHPTVPLNITDEDLSGPITTRVKESRDYYMIFSIVFLCVYIVSRIFGNYLLSVLVYFFEIVKDHVTRWRSRGQEKEKEE